MTRTVAIILFLFLGTLFPIRAAREIPDVFLPLLANRGNLSQGYEPDVKLIISEIYVNPSAGQAQWIELYNPTGLTLNLTKWQIGNKVRSVSLPPNIVIGPYQTAVLTASLSAFAAAYLSAQCPMVEIGAMWPEFSAEQDSVRLLDANRNMVDCVGYGDTQTCFPTGLSAPDAGHSWERVNPDTDSDSSSDWRYVGDAPHITPTPCLLPASDFFIVAGNSNAVGSGQLNDDNEPSHPRVTMFANDYERKLAHVPVDDATNQVDLISRDGFPEHAFSLSAAKGLLAKNQRRVELIPCPKGGKQFSHWFKHPDPLDRDTLFGSCNYRVSVAAPDGVTALWWYHGETDALSAQGRQDFEDDQAKLLRHFRKEWGGGLPVVFVQLAKAYQSDNPERNSWHQEVAEVQRRMETNSGYENEIKRFYMAVAFDLPLVNDDLGFHLDQAGQTELGRRIGLATREHVYGEVIDGTGPRLAHSTPLIHPWGDKTRIQIRFDRPINEAVNQYDGQFRVFDGGDEVAIADVQRDPGDENAVLILLDAPIQGGATVSYGDVPAPPFGVGSPNVIKGANDLPAPRFGPLPVVGTE